MLTLNQVAYRWPNAAADCLHAISLELQDGEWLALTGDNGAGKSTLLRIMSGLLSPTSGSVTLNGEPISQLKNRQRAAAIGVLFQEAENQIFHSNVAQEVAFGLKLQRLSAEEISRRTQGRAAVMSANGRRRGAPARSARRAAPDGGGRQSGGDGAACAIAG